MERLADIGLFEQLASNPVTVNNGVWDNIKAAGRALVGKQPQTAQPQRTPPQWEQYFQQNTQHYALIQQNARQMWRAFVPLVNPLMSLQHVIRLAASGDQSFVQRFRSYDEYAMQMASLIQNIQRGLNGLGLALRQTNTTSRGQSSVGGMGRGGQGYGQSSNFGRSTGRQLVPSYR